MATQLERATSMFKKGFIGCLILIVVFILFDWISKKLNPTINVKQSFVDVNYKFGDLPELTFNSLPLAENSNPKYSLETNTFPTLPEVNIVNVYKVKKPKGSLASDETAYDLARILGFNNAPEVLDSLQTEYRWSSTGGTKVLNYNKLTKKLTLTTDYNKDASAKEDKDIPDNLDLFKGNALKLFSTLNILPNDYGNGYQTAEFLDLDNSLKFVKSDSSTSADFVRVYLFRKLESLSVYIPEDSSEEMEEWLKSKIRTSNVVKMNPKEGQLKVLYGGTSNSINDIYEINYTNWEVDTSVIGKYTILDKQVVLDDIQSRKGYIRYLVNKKEDPNKEYTPLDVDIFYIYNLEIAYLETDELPEYLLPIYYCSGEALLTNRDKADFIIYYPAIDYSKIPK